jgi:hypothetical protein
MPHHLRSKLTSAKQDVPPAGRLAAAAIVATVIAGLAAAGCGSSKSTTTATTPAVSKPAFLTKANAICTKGNTQTSAAGASLGSNPSQAQLAAVVKGKYVPSIQAQIDGIRALAAPAGDKATVTKMLDLAQADLNKVKRKPSLLAGKTNPFADFGKLAHPYGLKACAPDA